MEWYLFAGMALNGVYQTMRVSEDDFEETFEEWSNDASLDYWDWVEWPDDED